jgi:triosephosphate isomerase
MNGSSRDVQDYSRSFPTDVEAGCDITLCLPAPLLPVAKEAFRSRAVRLGGQNCHPDRDGAQTGEIAAEMIADVGAECLILGHSERREGFGETDALIHRKVEAAHRAGLKAILCVGETLALRQSGQHVPSVLRQITGSLPSRAVPANTMIAYEPVWAIGSGLSATVEQVEEMHAAIKVYLGDKALPVLYGGSVKPESAAELAAISSVDGFLVGGASLDPHSFGAIARASTTGLA